MSASDWGMQFISDIIGAPVDRPKILETTALGTTWLAGSDAGIYPRMKKFATNWALDHRFEPEMAADVRDARYAAWKRTIDATLSV